jgi:hypothetical protein
MSEDTVTALEERVVEMFGQVCANLDDAAIGAEADIALRALDAALGAT